ncbi:MAG: response regulator [Actinomycetota bacterium]|jgi:diguanylate cyclase (GGDEF)-like protein|nr:response regulator [Actinomycetota bacterium]
MPAEPAAEQAADLEAAARVQALWVRFQPQMLARVESIEEALAALVESRLDDELRRRAERDAHRLAGSAGTLGRHYASVLARSLEELLTRPGPVDAMELSDALVQVESLRSELTDAPSADQSIAEDRPVVLVMHHDAELAAGIGLAVEARGLASQVATSVPTAREALDVAIPAVALVDLGQGDDGVLDLVRELSTRTPPVVVLAVTHGTGFFDRVEAVRAGIQAFLPGSLSPNELAGAAAATLEAAGRDRQRLLAVDDDPAVLAALVAILEPAGIVVTGVTEPERFWATLRESAPDLVVLDLDMPVVSGTELCRLLRADPRWSALPVVFLTSHVGRDTIEAIFAAGADDYVPKPVGGPELVTRITNRLERTKILQARAETDPLTGLANRRKFESQWTRLQAMAERYGQPLSFALLDLDHFREVNNRYGHEVGDVVLKHIGRLLSECFRGEDVVARWGGEEIALAMYGMSRSDGVRRVTDALRAISEKTMATPDGQSFRVSFSGGVSEHKVDGATLLDLYRRADEALYAAKALGRSRVLPAGEWRDVHGYDRLVDVVVVEDDDVVAELLAHALADSGYRSLCVNDGQAAVELLTDASRQPPRLVLLDISLPSLDGFAVLEHLRRTGMLEATRVIVLTARSSEEEILRALAAGAFDHVGKPFSLPVLMHRVRRALAG